MFGLGLCSFNTTDVFHCGKKSFSECKTSHQIYSSPMIVLCDQVFRKSVIFTLYVCRWEGEKQSIVLDCAGMASLCSGLSDAI